MKTEHEYGWVLRDLKDNGFVVDDPIEGHFFTILLNHADVWATKEEAVEAGKQRKYVLVTPVRVRLNLNKTKATAVDFAEEQP